MEVKLTGSVIEVMPSQAVKPKVPIPVTAYLLSLYVISPGITISPLMDSSFDETSAVQLSYNRYFNCPIITSSAFVTCAKMNAHRIGKNSLSVKCRIIESEYWWLGYKKWRARF